MIISRGNEKIGELSHKIDKKIRIPENLHVFNLRVAFLGNRFRLRELFANPRFVRNWLQSWRHLGGNRAVSGTGRVQPSMRIPAIGALRGSGGEAFRRPVSFRPALAEYHAPIDRRGAS